MQNLEFQKNKEKLYAEKIGVINQGKKEDLTALNKDNMTLSYEIDQLSDRIASKKQSSFFVTEEPSLKNLQSGSLANLKQPDGNLLDYAKLQKMPKDQQEDLMYFVQHIERLEKENKRLRTEHQRTGALDNER